MKEGKNRPSHATEANPSKLRNKLFIEAVLSYLIKKKMLKKKKFHSPGDGFVFVPSGRWWHTSFVYT